MKGKFKAQNENLVCWGRNTVLSLLESRPDLCRYILLADNSKGEPVDLIREKASMVSVRLEQVATEKISAISGDENHQGVVAVLREGLTVSFDSLCRKVTGNDGPSLLIVLDHIQDPHNMGAIIRSAEVAGADGVIFPDRRSASINGTVLKVSAGAALRLPLISVVNLSRTIDRVKEMGYWSIGLHQEGEHSIWDNAMPSRLALVLGSEGKGLTRLVRERCDELRSIPMKGTTGSLNVSVAAAIGIFEWLRCSS